MSVSSRDSPHVPDVYLDAGPHPHQSRLSAGRSLSDIIGFDHAGVCETSAKARNFSTINPFEVRWCSNLTPVHLILHVHVTEHLLCATRVGLLS